MEKGTRARKLSASRRRTLEEALARATRAEAAVLTAEAFQVTLGALCELLTTKFGEEGVWAPGVLFGRTYSQEWYLSVARFLPKSGHQQYCQRDVVFKTKAESLQECLRQAADHFLGADLKRAEERLLAARGRL